MKLPLRHPVVQHLLLWLVALCFVISGLATPAVANAMTHATSAAAQSHTPSPCHASTEGEHHAPATSAGAGHLHASGELAADEDCAAECAAACAQHCVSAVLPSVTSVATFSPNTGVVARVALGALGLRLPPEIPPPIA